MKKKLGIISVDAGIVWIGDPCYILHCDKEPKDIGRNWKEFCDKLDSKGLEAEHAAQFNFDGQTAHPGMGVVTETAYGDGVYPVFGEIDSKGRLLRVTIDFDCDLDNEEDEEEQTGFEDKDDEF